MRQLRTPPFLAPLVALTFLLPSRAQTSPPPDVPTFRSTSTLVFLDVTVLDKKGRPVTKGLSKSDFAITEDKHTQRIFSFEAPETHTLTPTAGDENPDGKAPVAIFVLDQLNSNFEDFAFIRDSMLRYLATQPAQLSAPAELMVIGNQSLELLQGFTRSREDLQFAVRHLPAALPYKQMSPSFLRNALRNPSRPCKRSLFKTKASPDAKTLSGLGTAAPA